MRVCTHGHPSCVWHVHGVYVHTQVLLAALTNVAVDNVLEGLLAAQQQDEEGGLLPSAQRQGEGRDDGEGSGGGPTVAAGDDAGGGGGGSALSEPGWVRVGSVRRIVPAVLPTTPRTRPSCHPLASALTPSYPPLQVRRIAPAVLPYSTHGRLARDDEVAARRELEREIASSASAAEQATLRRAVSLIDSGKMAAKARSIDKYRLVGATCAATGLACMAGRSFDIVLLDECSQARASRACTMCHVARACSM